MTNGEKIKEMFPTFKFIKETEKYRTPQHQFLKVYGVNKMPYMEFDLGWWNAEYKEPFKPMVEIDLDYVIKQKYIERGVLDKIRAEIEQTHETIDGFLMHKGTKETVLSIIDKHKAESEE